MPVPHPLNQAVITQALNDLRSGQLRRCKAMGFSEQDLEALKHPAATSLLIHTCVPWCTVTINADVLRRILVQVRDVQQEVQWIDRMVWLGASTDMISHFCGITHQEVAFRRRVLDLPTRRGRWPEPSEELDTLLWDAWRDRTAGKPVDLSDKRAVLDVCMAIAEEHIVPLSIIWTRMQQWTQEGLMP